MHQYDIGAYSLSSPVSVAIGVFDGVHLGHQAVLEQCRAAADAKNLRSVCLTFHPHPSEILAPAKAPDYICSLSQRIEFIFASGFVDDVVVAPFTLEFAQLSPSDFVQKILIDKLHVAQICVGADFRYGRARAGSVMDLESQGDLLGFSVEVVHAVSNHARRVSSTDVRHCVASGDMAQAKALLGRDFTLRGKVIVGKQLGRKIGFPTINIEPESNRQILPADGVYAGYTQVRAEKNWVRSAISVGTNPTTDGDGQRKVEAYLLDGFNQDIYGQSVDVSFVERLRDQAKYDSVELLVDQIRRDVESVELNLRPSA